MAEDKGTEPVDEGMEVVPDAPLADVPTIIPELEDVVSQLATDVSFARKTWKDGSEGATPITAAELNRLEKGVSDLTSTVNALRDSVCQREFVVKAGNSPNVTFTVSGWDDGIYYIIGAAPFSETAAFSDAMVRVLEGKPYVQSLHGNVSLSGDTITVSGDGWYTYVVKFLLTNLQ